MIKIFRKEGWDLNPKDGTVNAILRLCEANNGECPCVHPDNDGDLKCPCDSYRLRDKCCCQLYLCPGTRSDPAVPTKEFS